MKRLLPPDPEVEARRQLDRLLPRAATDAEVELLEEERYMDPIRGAIETDAGSAAIEEEARRAAAYLMRVRHSQEAVLRRGPRVLPPDQRVEALADEDKLSRETALSVAIGYLAARDEEIAAFVREELGGVRLTDRPRAEWIDTAAWIEREWQQERMGPDLNEQPLPQLAYMPVPMEDAKGVLRYQPLRTLTVVPGGKLDRLRLLAERVAKRYSWEPAAAINYILSDVRPTISTLTTHVQWRDDMPVLTRITLTVDPAMTPKAVSAAYSKVRNKIVKAPQREMERKTLFLAMIMLGRPASEPLESLMTKWNTLWFGLGGQGKPRGDNDPYKNWWYDDVQKFGRDKRAAVQRLLHPDYHRPTEDVEEGHGISDDNDA